MQRPASPSTVPDLGRLRRRHWWHTVGLIYLLGAFAVVPVVYGEPSLVVAVVAILAAVGGVVTSAQLAEHRLASADAVAQGADGHAAGRLGAVAVTAAVTYVIAMLFLDAAQFPNGGPASWFDRETSWLWIPAVVLGAGAGTLPRRRGVAVVGGALAAMGLAAGTQLALTGAIVWPWMATEAAMTASIGVALLYGLHDWDLTVRLHRSHQLEAQLAVADERLRFAADLHDVQGHHLQVIALKSELAARLVESDPSAAATQMAEVQEHARTALADTQAVVHGYRRTSLGDELANATRVLEAAGIDGRVDHGAAAVADDVGEPGRQLLGLVVREATTNILRHSNAGRARLVLDIDGHEALLGIGNDGATAGSGPAGTGLATLAQRLDAAGGVLDWGREDDWFTVTARVPVATERP